MLAFLGAEIVLTPAGQGMKAAIATARAVRTTPKRDAAAVHHLATILEIAPPHHRREIWNDTGGNIDIFVEWSEPRRQRYGRRQVLTHCTNTCCAIVAVDPGGKPGALGRSSFSALDLPQGIGADFQSRRPRSLGHR